MKRNVTFQSKRAQIRIDRLLKLLDGKALPAKELAIQLHCDQSLVTEYLRHLRSEPRRVRIADYEVINGTKRPLYVLGSDPDAILTKQTSKEKYASMMADPVRRERTKERSRILDRKKREAVPLELRQRRRLRADEDPCPRILELLAKYPGYTMAQMAEKFDIGERSIRTAIGKLKKSGQVRRAKNGTMKAWQWETPDNPLPPPLVSKPQGIFAALGL